MDKHLHATLIYLLSLQSTALCQCQAFSAGYQHTEAPSMNFLPTTIC
jgi:hypothetical protein